MDAQQAEICTSVQCPGHPCSGPSAWPPVIILAALPLPVCSSKQPGANLLLDGRGPTCCSTAGGLDPDGDPDPQLGAKQKYQWCPKQPSETLLSALLISSASRGERGRGGAMSLCWPASRTVAHSFGSGELGWPPLWHAQKSRLAVGPKSATRNGNIQTAHGAKPGTTHLSSAILAILAGLHTHDCYIARWPPVLTPAIVMTSRSLLIQRSDDLAHLGRLQQSHQMPQMP